MTEWRGQEADLNIYPSGTTSGDIASGTSNYTVGIMKDVRVSVNRTVEELRGAGSTKRQDIQVTEIEVGVDGTLASFDMSAYGALIGTTSTVSGYGNLSSGADIDTFLVDVKLTPNDSSANHAYVSAVYFAEIPLDLDSDSWGELSLEGKGTDLLIT